MLGNAKLNELRLLSREATGAEGSSQPNLALREAFPALIDEITQLREENKRLRDTLGDVRQLLEVPSHVPGARHISTVGLL
ncbi:MAG TPA: hypothetical protein VLE23_12995 [Geminicoccaceae bacterium]|nr:hypothetical protein [Geminicoccaceae bacterium]